MIQFKNALTDSWKRQFGKFICFCLKQTNLYKAAYLQILGPSEMINTLIWVKSKFSIWLKNQVWGEGSHSSHPL